MKMRKLKETDLTTITQLAQTLSDYPWSLQNFTACLQPTYRSYLLVDQHKLIGFVIALFVADEAQLLNIGIAKDYQRKGYATQLLQHITLIASKEHMHHILLEVRAGHTAAIALYNKNGYSQLAIRKDYYPAKSGREDAMIMHHELF